MQYQMTKATIAIVGQIIAATVRTASWTTEIKSASVVNMSKRARVAHDIGKLNTAPSVVSVTDSINAFLLIFIKNLFQRLYINTTAARKKGGSFLIFLLVFQGILFFGQLLLREWDGNGLFFYYFAFY